MTGDVTDRFDCDLARDLSTFMSTHPVGNDQDQRTILQQERAVESSLCSRSRPTSVET